jgi:hypothetical protein
LEERINALESVIDLELAAWQQARHRMAGFLRRATAILEAIEGEGDPERPRPVRRPGRGVH